MASNRQPRILLLDIETAPAVALTWGGRMYEENLIKIVRPWYILSFAIKWLGDKRGKTYALPDYPAFKKDKYNDFFLIKELHRLLSEADIVIAHNGDKFDLKKITARMVFWGLQPPSPYKTIDTLKFARKHGFTSNRLNDLAMFLGVGSKLPHQGMHTWEGAGEGDKKSWATLRKYNLHDVDPLLEGVYLRLRPWANNHPNLNSYTDREACPACQSANVQYRGFRVAIKRKFHRLQCSDCGHWFSGQMVKT